MKGVLAAAVCAPLLGGCLLTDKTDPALDIPEAYKAGPKNPVAAEAALPELDWWRDFRSRELTAIIEEAREANLDVAVAVARIIQADAQARVAGAALLPAINANADGTRSRSSSNTGTNQDGNFGGAAGAGGGTGGSRFAPIRTVYSASLTASYEIDFWGKNRAALRSAEETAVASRFNKDVVALATVVSAANAYFQVLAAQDRLRVARDNLTSATRVLDLIKQRSAAGTASQLEISQQESLVATQRATIPPLEILLRQNQHALALLLARPPESVIIRGGSLRAIAIPRVTPGLPSELIAQRPDIRQAEANLSAANFNVYNARAAMLPSITLTGEGGYQSAVLRTLFRPESAFFNLAAGLTQPIFDGLRLQGQLDLTLGQQEELLQLYRRAVISGFVDVDNALVSIQQAAQLERLQQQAVAASRVAFDIAERRLREGAVDLVTVLQTQQSLFQAEDALAQARLQRLQAVVSLFQALGGGWKPKPAPVVVEATDAEP